MPSKTGIEDYANDDTTQFVLQWNDWSTADDRQEVYRTAWDEVRRGRSALAFIAAVAAQKKVPVPEHIQDYLRKHRDFSDTFQRAFKKVRKNDWRLGVVVDQTNLESFPPEVTLLKDSGAQLVMLYVVGDATI
ncbi:MAG: hypothetical protein QM711_07320 [Micropruina sp.]|uniref:hypothetical protein n=1 Tax=Micropruina sp. TaxID=2737536 RepID=UPI0039E62048